MTRILIAEDEKPISELIKLALTKEGYFCTAAYDGEAAADLIERESFDLCLLDIMLPKIDGYELLQYAACLDLPVIFITAKTGVEDRVRGLRAGAEDYISKPFECSELTARVEAVLRRRGAVPEVIRLGDVTVDRDARVVKKGGREVTLTAKEFDLLLYMYKNKNRALYRHQIYAGVWGGDMLGDSRTVDLHIQRLRKKLSLEKTLLSVHTIGYRLEVRA